MNKVILAPAGGRKTQSIVEKCQLGDESQNRLIVTYTTTGQKVLQERIWQDKNIEGEIEILGWFSFLLKNFVYPYVNDLYPGQAVNGLHFVEGKDPTRFRKATKRYFDDAGKVYSNRIGKLAYDIALASNGACINRLEGIFDEIYFDEVQDLGGNDLKILELLFESKIKIVAVGDVRQSVYSTSPVDRKYENYKGLHKIKWFREIESLGLCEIEEITKTWRCNQDIVDFADSVLPKDLEFPETKSMNTEETGHDGIFLVSWKNLQTYINEFNPECYRHNIKSKILTGTEAINFGLCKGKTVPRVLIYPTGPMKDFLKSSKNALKDQSASIFYVAVTRAMHSVAIVVDKPEQYNLEEWAPEVR